VTASPSLLPSPGVAFGTDYLRRLGRLVARLSAARERREGAGSARLFGVGTEFVGYRPYRPGEDPRQLDWNLYARLRRPFVRVNRREASEHWALLVDSSASMGVGVPGKLQCAAETATAIAACGLRAGAIVDLWTSGEGRFFRLRKSSELAGWMTLFEEERAQGERGVAALLRESARVRGAGRVFVLGDLLDLEPAALVSLVRRGRELFFSQILALEELAPSRGDGAGGMVEGAVEWVDPETGEETVVEVDRRARAGYEKLLAGKLEAWGSACARHRATFGCWASATPFEAIVKELFR
jgi:uncharacterized protein (DUF58 family)